MPTLRADIRGLCHEVLGTNYTTLREYVLAHLERRKQQKIIDQAHRQTGDAHVGKTSSPSGDANRQQGECFKMKQCGKFSAGDECPYSHEGLARKQSQSKGKGKGT